MHVAPEKSDDIMEFAFKIKNEFDTVSQFIQKHTSKVCPFCKKVCCIDKHGYYDREDLVFFSALGVALPPHRPRRKDNDPCRFLNGNGCFLERWKRPFRCTWYFCEPLLESMGEDSGRVYRDFISSFQSMMSIRQRFLQETRDP